MTLSFSPFLTTRRTNQGVVIIASCILFVLPTFISELISKFKYILIFPPSPWPTRRYSILCTWFCFLHLRLISPKDIPTSVYKRDFSFLFSTVFYYIECTMIYLTCPLWMNIKLFPIFCCEKQYCKNCFVNMVSHVWNVYLFYYWQIFPDCPPSSL